MGKDKNRIKVGVGAVILDKGKRILLLRRTSKTRNNHNKWAIPGGGVEFGEDRSVALKREIKEELGCDLIILNEIWTIDHATEEQRWVATHYLCNPKGQIENREPEKHDMIQYFSYEEAKKLDLSDFMPRLLEKLKEDGLFNK